MERGAPDVRREGFVVARVGRVLRGVKHVDVDARRLGRHKERVLRHVARAVDFALVQDALVDLDLGRDRVRSVAAALCAGRSGRKSATICSATKRRAVRDGAARAYLACRRRYPSPRRPRQPAGRPWQPAGGCPRPRTCGYPEAASAPRSRGRRPCGVARRARVSANRGTRAGGRSHKRAGRTYRPSFETGSHWQVRLGHSSACVMIVS
jgi:hypothetical protein